MRSVKRRATAFLNGLQRAGVAHLTTSWSRLIHRSRATSPPVGSTDEALVRVITYNTAAGNPRIKTPQAAFLELPFYREAFAGEHDAPILALQEVGRAQAKALRAAARGSDGKVLQMRRPGLGNAIVVPRRYRVVRSRRRFYLRSQVRGITDGVREARRTGQRPNWRQYGELRSWIEVTLDDGASGRRLTVLTTHLSLDPCLRASQAHAIVRRADAARARGPVILAADLNVPKGRERGRDRKVAELLAGFRDAGTATPAPRPDIDYVLVTRLEPVSCRIWTGASLQLPGSPSAELVSDHYPEDDVLRYARTNGVDRRLPLHERRPASDKEFR